MAITTFEKLIKKGVFERLDPEATLKEDGFLGYATSRSFFIRTANGFIKSADLCLEDTGDGNSYWSVGEEGASVCYCFSLNEEIIISFIEN